MTITTRAERPLDLRGLSSAERSPQVLDSFDGLGSGERLVLVCGDTASDSLECLQKERHSLFEWSMLESGPPIWRIEVARRAGPAGGPRGVNEALSWDHDRLDAVERAAFDKRALGNFDFARRLYAEFATGLKRHIGFEERLLFPAFEEATGMPSTAGPTAVMRAEHREIEGLLVGIEAGIAEAAVDVESLRQRLHAILEDHNLKEEQILYPTTDQLLGEEEADHLVAQIQCF